MLRRLFLKSAISLAVLPSKAFSTTITNYDLAILNKTIWGEARGESSLGRKAVVHVIFNRLKTNNHHFMDQKTIASICLKKFQFSCWLFKNIHQIKNDHVWKSVKRDVREAIEEYQRGIDHSNGAILYYSEEIVPPLWIYDHIWVKQIGKHIFYR